jgi:Nif-specific regulatory protein
MVGKGHFSIIERKAGLAMKEGGVPMKGAGSRSTDVQGLGERLEQVLQLCRAMHEQRNPHDLLQLIAREAAALLEAELASIFLFDQSRRELISQATLDGQQIRFDARLGIAGAAVMSKQLLNVTDAQQDARFHSAVDAETKFRTRNVLAVPVLDSAHTCLGVLQALNKRRGPFTKADEDLASILSVQAAIALAAVFKTVSHELPGAVVAPKDSTHRITTRDIIGESVRIQDIVRLIDQLRETAVDVLVTGESGTGKELVARALHSSSARASGPFIAINCGALPDNLIESELFGIEKGVATGVERRMGKFEEAHGGTIFLDEIGDLNQAAQVKLLRVLQERVVMRVGGRVPMPIDVRVVAATNTDLPQAVEQGRFRSDLYFRLKVVMIHLPALRDIPEDIPVLAKWFLRKYAGQFGKEEKLLTDGALRRMLDYAWPGNARELENEMKRLMASVRKTVVSEQDLDESIRGKENRPGGLSGESSRSLKAAVEQLERQMIREALAQSKGNQARAAKMLALSRQGLIKKLKRYGM